jgi:hypothetical protein
MDGFNRYTAIPPVVGLFMEFAIVIPAEAGTQSVESLGFPPPRE